ncbi:MAG: VOC family protein [Deltaproteobacteria bacterium]|nr:MAG: VOC family protein [Deltaproteobacteria bacterium]
MQLGAFSVSLSVKDLATSRSFYETLGFAVTGGNAEHGWLVLRNGDATIGLFQGMFEGNILTFAPGLDRVTAGPMDAFQDVRDIQAALREAGIEPQDGGTDPAATGPAHIRLVDPDGNAILIDQFFPRPGA